MTTICKGGYPFVRDVNGAGGLFLPLIPDWEAEWPDAVKVILYLAGLLYCFAGVGVVSDIFMSAIEKITSKKRTVERGGKIKTVKVWNDTVANLTLMALGSSAPEILLGLIELVFTEKMHSGSLGPSTIVGSAAFNLLVIIAVCVSALPDGEVRRIKNLGVFFVTAFFSVFAYVWMVIVLTGPTPDVVSVWEGILTLLFAPLFVWIAYLVDIGFVHRMWGKLHPKPLVLTENSTPEECEEMSKLILEKYGRLPEEQFDKDALMIFEFAPTSSRAAHRVHATRMLSAGPVVLDTKQKWVRGRKVADLLKSERKGAGPAEDPVVTFDAAHYAVAESEKKVTVRVNVHPHNHEKTIRVRYKTRGGSAEEGKDYKQASGSLAFGPGCSTKTFDITIYEDKIHEPTEEFYVDLKDVKNATLSHPMEATIVVVDSDGPGKLAFAQEEIKVGESTDKVRVRVVVNRTCGATGEVSCKYHTEDDTAKAGHDYVEATGTLTFPPGVNKKTIELEVLPKSSYENTESFRLILDDPTGGASFNRETDGGKDCNILTVKIEADPGRKTYWQTLMSHFNHDEIDMGHQNWKEQFFEALYCGGSKEAQADATKGQWAIHLFYLPWKMIFTIMCPPTEFCGGWVCFFVSLLGIGLLTAVIGDMANLFGCSLNIKAEMCAITIVALGTSLPDTFASKTAALQDPTADNSIGNVTGSNSVNVFLGLGMPWTVGAIYWAVAGRTDGWMERGQAAGWKQNIYTDYPDGAFVVPSTGLATSVVVFSCCALTCIAVLMLRRKYCGGELGGKKKVCYATSGFLFLLWCLYIILSAVQYGGVVGYA